METKQSQPTPPPFISVFHHKDGISVSVLDGGCDAFQYWRDIDGFASEEDEYLEEFPLPEKYVRAVNCHEELLELLKFFDERFDGSNRVSGSALWNNETDLVTIAQTVKQAIARAEVA